jgi:hypothetical protein
MRVPCRGIEVKREHLRGLRRVQRHGEGRRPLVCADLEDALRPAVRANRPQHRQFTEWQDPLIFSTDRNERKVDGQGIGTGKKLPNPDFRKPRINVLPVKSTARRLAPR